MPKHINRDNTNAGLYEYSLKPVLAQHRRNASGLFLILSGYISTLSCIAVGSAIGASLPFWTAVGACIAGNLFVILIGTGLGVIASHTGWSASFLSRRLSGRFTSILFSLLITAFSIFWIGSNGRMFARALISAFPGWPLPLPVTSVLIIIPWACWASKRWKSLELIGRIIYPALLILIVFCAIDLSGKMNGLTFVSASPRNVSMTFSDACTAVIGNFIFGCLVTPESCRFARSPRTVMFACPTAFMAGLFLFTFFGILLGKAGGFPDMIRSSAIIGLSAPLLLIAFLCFFTTQNVNAYGGSLAMQNILQNTVFEGNVSHQTAVFIIAGFAAACSVFDLYSHFLLIISIFAITMIPVPGILFAEAFFLHNQNEHKKFNLISLFSWASGILTGALLFHYKQPAAPFAGFAATAIIYIGLYTIKNRKGRYIKNESNHFTDESGVSAGSGR